MPTQLHITDDMDRFQLTSRGWIYRRNELEDERCVCKRSARPATPLHVDLRCDDDDEILRACPHAKDFFTDLFFDVNEGFVRGIVSAFPPPYDTSYLTYMRAKFHNALQQKYGWSGKGPIMCSACK